MRFEERELKPYAQPVSVGNLKEGEVYFSVTFIDDEMCIPTMETLVFIGRDLNNDDSGRLYFQDVDSYMEGIRYDSAQEEDYVTD
jgi:hypothetical protein